MSRVHENNIHIIRIRILTTVLDLVGKRIYYFKILFDIWHYGETSLTTSHAEEGIINDIFNQKLFTGVKIIYWGKKYKYFPL